MIVIGDIHGQFFDMMHMYEKMVKPPVAHLLFLGDYVDRGIFSVEVLIFLFALKACFPNRVTMLRGNHECRAMTEFFTFREECIRKYDQEVYEMFMETFDLMPVAAVANKDYLCVHGGISPTLNNAEDINQLDRF